MTNCQYVMKSVAECVLMYAALPSARGFCSGCIHFFPCNGTSGRIYTMPIQVDAFQPIPGTETAQFYFALQLVLQLAKITKTLQLCIINFSNSDFCH